MCWFSIWTKSAVDPLAQEFIDFSSFSKRERERDRNNFLEKLDNSLRAKSK